MNDHDDPGRWYLIATAGLVAVVTGGVVLYGVIEDDPVTGVMLALGAFIVSLGVTLLVEDLRRWVRRRRRRRGR